MSYNDGMTTTLEDIRLLEVKVIPYQCYTIEFRMADKKLTKHLIIWSIKLTKAQKQHVLHIRISPEIQTSCYIISNGPQQFVLVIHLVNRTRGLPTPILLTRPKYGIIQD